MISTIVNSLANRSDRPVNEIISATRPTNLAEELKLLLGFGESTDYPFVTFQVSLGWKSTLIEPKLSFENRQSDHPYLTVNATGWGSKYPKPHYKGIDWHTVRTSINVLPDIIREGFTVRYGIKLGSNSKNDFDRIEFIGLDLDTDPTVTPRRTLEILAEYLIEPLCLYYSPSGNEHNNKMRAIIAVDTAMNYDEYWDIVLRIGQILPNCNPIVTANQFWYGTIKELIYVSPAYTQNNLSELKENLPQLAPSKQEASSKESTAESNHNSASEYYRDQVSRLIQEHYNDDPTALIDYWVQQLNETEQGSLYSEAWIYRGSQNGSLISWNSVDPIIGGTSGQSNSFALSQMPDGSYQFNSRKTGQGGDLITLFIYMKAGSWDTAFSSASYVSAFIDLMKLQGLEGLSYAEYCKRNTFKSLPYWLHENPKTGEYFINPDEMFVHFMDEHQGLIIKNTATKSFYQYSDDYWHILSIERMKGIIRDWAVEYIPNIAEKYTAKVATAITTHLNSLPYNWVTDKSFEFSSRYLPFDNGIFDLETKQLLEHNRFYLNTYKFNFNYCDRSQNHSLKQPLVNFFDWVLDDQIYGNKRSQVIDDLINWVIAVLQLKGYDTLRMLLLVGDPDSGKTDFCNLMSKLLGSFTVDCPSLAVNIDVKQLIDSSKNFARAKIIGKTLLIFNEFSGVTDSSLLKTLLGGSKGTSASIDIEHKYGAQEQVNIRTTFLSNSETMPRLLTKGTQEDGWNRRILIAKCKHRSEHNSEVFRALKDEQWLKDFYLWAIGQDIEPFTDRCQSKDTFDHWMKPLKQELATSNSYYAEFITECLEYDSEMASNNKGTPSGEVYNAYVNWTTSEGRKNPGSQTKFGIELKKLLPIMLGTENDLQHRTSQGKIYLGIKIKDN